MAITCEVRFVGNDYYGKLLAELLPQLSDPLVHPGEAVHVSDIVHDKCAYPVIKTALTLRVPVVDRVQTVVHLLSGSIPYGELVQLALIVSLVSRSYVLLEEEGVEGRRLIEVKLVLGKAYGDGSLADSRYKVSAIHMAGPRGAGSLTLA